MEEVYNLSSRMSYLFKSGPILCYYKVMIHQLHHNTFFFTVLGIEPRARQAFYHLNHIPIPSISGFTSDP
jgi:hypothetical protein